MVTSQQQDKIATPYFRNFQNPLMHCNDTFTLPKDLNQTLWTSSPLEKTVVLGVTSRSRDGLKGKAHDCDSLLRSSSTRRGGGADLWRPMFNTQTWSQAQPRLSTACLIRTKELSVLSVYLWTQQQEDPHCDDLLTVKCKKREEKQWVWL